MVKGSEISGSRTENDHRAPGCLRIVGADGTTLKLLAVFAMALDHTGIVFFPGEQLFRAVGRLAFPIFAFFLVEGFFHTHDVRKYLLRLGIFAVISEIPYDLAIHGKILEWGGQNVFLTLFLGVVMMVFMRSSNSRFISSIYLLLTCYAAYVLHVDYSFRGILLIAVFYVFYGDRTKSLFAGGAWNLIYLYYHIPIQLFGMLAMLPLSVYNGRRGKDVLPGKWFFYGFYPLHLLLLWGIRRVMSGL